MTSIVRHWVNSCTLINIL